MTGPGDFSSGPDATATAAYAAVVPSYGAASEPYGLATAPYAADLGPYAVAPGPYAAIVPPYAAIVPPYAAIVPPYGATTAGQRNGTWSHAAIMPTAAGAIAISGFLGLPPDAVESCSHALLAMNSVGWGSSPPNASPSNGGDEPHTTNPAAKIFLIC